MRNTKTGFTLAELLVYQALALMVLYLASSYIFPSLSLQARGLDQAERLRSAHQLLAQVCADLRQAPQSSLTYQSAQGWLTGRPLGGWTSDGTVLMADQGWFYDFKGMRRAELSWQASFNLPLTWKERLSPQQQQTCEPGLPWHRLSSEPASLEFTPADPKPGGPFKLHLSMGDLKLQATVRSRQLR